MPLTRDELATAAGTTAGEVDRLARYYEIVSNSRHSRPRLRGGRLRRESRLCEIQAVRIPGLHFVPPGMTVLLA